jgi:hypothetical protein
MNIGGDCKTTRRNNPAVLGDKMRDMIQAAYDIKQFSWQLFIPILFLPPAEDPNAVTLLGSPPNDAMFF